MNVILLWYNVELWIVMSWNFEIFFVLNVDCVYGNYYLIDFLCLFMMDGLFGAFGVGVTLKVFGVGVILVMLLIVLFDDMYFFQWTLIVFDDEFGIVFVFEVVEIVLFFDFWVMYVIVMLVVIGLNIIILFVEIDLILVLVVFVTLIFLVVSIVVDLVVVLCVVFFDQISCISQV